MDAEEVLANCPMISVEEAAPLIGVDDSTVRRHFQELRLRGLATYHDVGRAGHREQRWIPTRGELRLLYTYPEDVPWWSIEGGLRSALPRVEWHGPTYFYASKLFQQANKDWYDGNATRWYRPDVMRIHKGAAGWQRTARTRLDPSRTHLHGRFPHIRVLGGNTALDRPDDAEVVRSVHRPRHIFPG